MIVKFTLLFTLLAYGIIVSQSFMYILSLRYAQLNLSLTSYIELRKLVDASMRRRFRYPMYIGLLTNLILVISTIDDPSSLLFIAAAFAFVALVSDTMITVKGNIPVNDEINTWSAERYPANWADHRAKWLRFFQYRQIANISGFVALLVGAVFGEV